MPTPGNIKYALHALNAARPAYDEARAFYDGTVTEVIASRKLRQLFGRQGNRFRINHARTPVDVMVERTMVQGITCANAAAQDLLNRVWNANELGQEAKQVHRRAYEFGDGYLIGWPDDEVDGGVSFYAHDPTSVRVFYDPSRPRKKSHAVHAWTQVTEDGGFSRVNLYYPDRTEMWVSANPIARLDGTVVLDITQADFVPYESDDVIDGVVENEYGVVPVFHFRTDRPYGRPEHADAYGPQNVINKLYATLMGSVDFHGFPQRYVSTDDAIGAGAVSPGKVDPFTGQPTATTNNDALDSTSQMPSGPDEVWLLSGSNISVGQFNPPTFEPLISAIHSTIKQLSAITDIPGARFDRTGDTPSGEAFRMEDAPLNRKVEDRQAQFGVTWAEVFDFVLQVNGIAEEAQIAWAPPATYDDTDSWTAAKLQLEAGVPVDQVLRERGYPEDVIKLWLDGAQPVDQAAQTPSDTSLEASQRAEQAAGVGEPARLGSAPLTSP